MGSPVVVTTGLVSNIPNTRHPDMDSKLITSAATLLLLLCLVETGSGIKCHQCNSYDDYHCADPFYYADSPDVPKTDKFLKDCPNDGKESFCRKIYQNVRDDVRIIRGCGYIPDEKGREGYTTVLEEYNTEVCACNEDGATLPACSSCLVQSCQRSAWRTCSTEPASLPVS